MSAQAEAIIRLHTGSMRVRDYYIVGNEIFISRPHHPISQFENEELLSVALDYLRDQGVPCFESWEEYERRGGKCEVRKYREEFNRS